MPSVAMFKRELNKDDMERMRIPYRYWRVTYDEISDVPGEAGYSPKDIVRNYLEKLDEMIDEGFGLFMWGPNGSGKTSASVVIAKEVRRRGNTVLFVEAAAIKRMVVEGERFDEDETWWNRASNVDFLLLDDFGKGTLDRTGFGARLIDELIRHRNARKLVTFCTSNLDPRDDFDLLIQNGDMIISTKSTLKECMIATEVYAPDRRNDAQERGIDKLMS